MTQQNEQQHKGGDQYPGQMPGEQGQRTGPSTGGARGNDMPSESGTQKDGRGAQGGQPSQQPGQNQGGQKTGPSSGNPRGTDLPSQAGTQTDGRDAQGIDTHGQAQVQPPRGKITGGIQEHAGEKIAQAPGCCGEAKTGQPMDTSEETAGNAIPAAL